jgi:hypothetical protein
MSIEKAIQILQALWCYKNCDYSDTDIRKALDIAIKSLKKSNDIVNIQYEINNLPTYLAKFRDGKFSIQIEKAKVDKIIKRYRIGK